MNKSIPSELGNLIDMSIEDFKTYCADKDMGYLKGLENLMIVTYNQLQLIREDFRSKVVKKELRVDEVSKAVLELHAKMMRVEERVFTVREIQSSRTVKTSDKEC